MFVYVYFKDYEIVYLRLKNSTNIEFIEKKCIYRWNFISIVSFFSLLYFEGLELERILEEKKYTICYIKFNKKTYLFEAAK